MQRKLSRRQIFLDVIDEFQRVHAVQMDLIAILADASRRPQCQRALTSR